MHRPQLVRCRTDIFFFLAEPAGRMVPNPLSRRVPAERAVRTGKQE